MTQIEKDWILQNTIHQGDTLALLKSWPDACVDCVVTSPPYWSLRDYGVRGQLGLERTLDEYLAKIAVLFVEVRRVLKPTGTLWLNMGDCYANDEKWGGATGGKHVKALHGDPIGRAKRSTCLHAKNLIGQPWRIAFALQAAGWYLRADIIWHKPNPMPESVRDRPTKAHEYLFLLSKSERYFYDAEAIKEPSITNDPRRPYTSEGAKQLDGRPREQWHSGELRKGSVKRGGFNGKTEAMPGRNAFRAFTEVRNKRTVWTICPQPFRGAHFATFPEKLVEPCILAGCPPGGIVCDPFMGSGTVAVVAERLGRQWVGCELNPAYIKLAYKRIREARSKQSGATSESRGVDGKSLLGGARESARRR